MDPNKATVIVRSGTTAFLLQSLEAHRLDVALVNVAPARDAATPWVSHAIAEQPVSLIGTPARLGGERWVPCIARSTR